MEISELKNTNNQNKKINGKVQQKRDEQPINLKLEQKLSNLNRRKQK